MYFDYVTLKSDYCAFHMCAQNSTTDKWKKLQLIGPDRQFSLAPRSSEPWTDPAPKRKLVEKTHKGEKNKNQNENVRG